MKNTLFRKELIIVIIIIICIPTTGKSIGDFTTNNHSSNMEKLMKNLILSENDDVGYIFGWDSNLTIHHTIIFKLNNLEDFSIICYNLSLPHPYWPTGGSLWIQNSIMYICNIEGYIYKLDFEECEVEVIGNAGILGEFMDITYDPDKDVMWGINTKCLYRINMQTGNAILVGCLNNPYFMVDIACDNDGKLWGIEYDFSGMRFYSINTITGYATLVGNTGLPANFYTSLVCNKKDNTLYLSWFNSDTLSSKFYKINKNNGNKVYLDDFQTGLRINSLSIPYGQLTYSINEEYNINNPPELPEIEGQRIFKVGETGNYNYILSSTDPDNDYIRFLIEWEENISEWSDFTKSGEELEIVIPIFAENKGNYTVCRIKAVDSLGAGSDWAYLEITVPTNHYPKFTNFLNRFPLLLKIIERVLL